MCNTLLNMLALWLLLSFHFWYIVRNMIYLSQGERLEIEEVDVKDPYAFEEGRCHCCGEDIETAHLVS